MLVNNTKLKIKASGDSDFVELEGLKEIPDIGIKPENVDVTCLSDKNKRYEKGIGDLGELEYTFSLGVKNDINPSIKKLVKVAESDEVCQFEQDYPNGITVTFNAQVSYTLSGGKVNSAGEFKVTLTITSDITVGGLSI